MGEELTVESCAEEHYKTYTRLRVLGGSVEVLEGAYASRAPQGIILLFKSMREVSIDEVPIINSISAALSQRAVELRFNEYDSLLGEKSRYESFVAAVERSISESKGLVAVVPYPMAVGIVSRLSGRAQEALDSATVLSVRARYENLLYLPERVPEKGEPIELIGKENSASSYERIKWLSEEAERRGIRTTVKLFPDGRSIFDYVTSAGPKGIYKRVPVTKLSAHIVALARCYGLSGIDEIVRVEESIQTIYALNLVRDAIESLVRILLAELSAPRVATLREPYASWAKQGSVRIMAELIRRYGL